MKIDYKLNDKSLAQLCKYIALSAQQKTDFIDDVHLATDTAYSSVAVNEKMAAQATALKEYSEELVGGLTKLRYVLTTTQPTLANTQEGIVYLYSSTGQSPYQQYLKISSTQLIDLGSTNINLADFYSKNQADAKFATITNVNLISDAVVNKVSINQGVAKAGQMLIVSDSGTVTTTPFESADIDWTN